MPRTSESCKRGAVVAVDFSTHFDVYADIITACQWADSIVTIVDLDLDVVRHRDGSVEVIDVDEFEEHRHALGCPDEIVALAEPAAADVDAAIERQDEPFAASGWAWLPGANAGN
jgi:predicted RNA-binding protein associated with RNAse of E/G family